MFKSTYVGFFVLCALITFLKKADIFYFFKFYIVLIVITTILNRQALLMTIGKQAKYEIFKFSVSLYDNGIDVIADNYRVRLSWELFLRVVETERYIHIYTDSRYDIFIPKKAFSNEEEKKNFIEKLNNRGKEKIILVEPGEELKNAALEYKQEHFEK